MEHIRAGLPERPNARTFSVEDILHEAQAGRLRVPRFQTGLRWGGKEVVALFDSILRGFPVGSLLFWEREADAARLSFGPGVVIDAPEVANANFIVDGQQRITALVGALTREDEEPVGDAYAVWIDLQNGQFHRPRSRNDVEHSWIPINLFGDRHRLLRWSRRLDSDDPLIDLAFEAESRLMKYPVPAYIVRNATESSLRQIFSRTNRAGKSLTEVQVFNALFGASEQPRPFELLAHEIDDATGFGVLPAGWLLRCLKAVGGLSPKSEFSETLPPDGELMERTRAALLRAIKFLQADTGFLHANLLPYRFALIVLARFFDRHPNPSPRNRTLLTRWLWRGALTGEHAASSHAAVTNHQNDIGDDESGAVQRLLGRADFPGFAGFADPGEQSEWSARSAVTRLHATVILNSGVANPVTEAPFDVSYIREQLRAHPLSDLFVQLLPQRREIANYVFLPPEFELEQLLDAPHQVLSSHALDDIAMEALRSVDVDAFYERRIALLEEVVDRKLAQLALGQDDGDRPPIADILARAATGS